MIERWKDIKDYEGIYQVSNCGRICSLRSYKHNKKRLLKPGHWNGYPCINLWKHNQPTTYKIHTLVLNTFIGACPKNMECRHLDGNPQNNQLDNLRWGTRSENQKDAVNHGTNFRPDNRGSNNGHAKLTETQVKKIKNLLIVKRSHIQIAKLFNVDRKTIYDIDNNKTWRHI